MKSMFTRAKGTAKTKAAGRKAEAAVTRPLLAFALEQRFMFDAAGAATADPAATNHATDPAVADHTADQAQHDALAAAAASAAAVGTTPATAPPAEVRAADPALNNGKREVAFIESNVADRQILMNGVTAGVEVVLLDSGQDGLSQMAQWAQTHTGYDAVHVISHGGEGRIYLGALTLDTATAEARGADLAALGSALTENGDLLLYGCDVATNAGQGFVAAIAAATRADVAASINETGAARLGGDWVLETAFGSIETAALYGAGEADGYDHVLGTTEVATETALNTAIANAADGDIIVLTADITLTGALTPVTKSITIQGNYHKIDGDSTVGWSAFSIDARTAGTTTLTVEKTEFVNTDGAVVAAANDQGAAISIILRDSIVHDSFINNNAGAIVIQDADPGDNTLSLTVERSIFYNNPFISVLINSSDHLARAGNSVSATIRDSLFYTNTASPITIHSNEDTGTSAYAVNLINNTIVNNTGGVTVEQNSSMSAIAPTVNIRNSIILGNSDSNGYDANTVGTITATTNSIINSNLSTVNFVDFAGNDFRLASTASNALNQGNSSYATGSTDVRGMDRIRQGTVDMGAYESSYTNAGVAGIGPASDLNGNAGGTNNTVSVANGAATNVTLFDSAATITQPDSELNLTGITVALTGIADSGSEKLALTTVQIAAARLNNITVTGNDSATLTLSGGASLANYQTVLRQILYSNVAGTPTAGNRTVTVTPTDDISGASPSTATLTIRPGNTAAPVLDATKSPVLTSQPLSTSTAVPTGAAGTPVSTLVNTTGVANFSDGDGDSPGMAITATDTTSGTWYYTTDGGTTWTAVGTVSNTSALLLAADADSRLFFKANSGYSGTLSSAITFRAWDRSTGTAGSKVTTATNGAATAFSTATDTASLTVTDDVAPTVSGVTSSTTDGTYGTGSTISIQVTFSEAVTVTGTPQLTLETGTTDRTISYVGGSGTNTLTFTYTVQAGDTSSDLNYQSTSALALNGGTIKDTTGNDATLTLPATGNGSSLGGAKAIVIDTAPAITSAIYDANTNTLVVTGTNITDGATIDVTKLTLTGEGGSTYTLTSNSSVTSAPSSNGFTITLGATDQTYVEGLLNKNSTSSQDSTTYNLAAAANWNSTQSAAADLTGNGITVSNTQKPTVSSVSYDATTGVLTVTGTNLVHQPGPGNDIDLSKLTVTGQGGTVTLSGAVEITSATSFTVTLTGTDKTNLNAKLDKNGGTSTGGTTYRITSADNWNGPVYGDISDSTGVGITVSGNNAAPVISDLNGDTKSWGGVGGTVFLDTFSGVTGIASVTDAENNAANWGGGSLTVQRATGGAWSADVFAFSTIYFVDTPTGATSGTLRYYTQATGDSFASYTNTNGVLTITLNSAATTAMVSNLFSGINYRNDTPAGDATIRFSLNDGHGATTTADVTVTTNFIYVTGTGDGGTVDVTDGVGLREAVAIAAGQTGTQTIVLGSALANGTISLGSDLAIGENVTIDADAASGLTITGSTITVASGTTLTLTNGASDTLTIASKITGSGGFAKTGAGTLTLSGGNDYSGATSVNANSGTLVVTGTLNGAAAGGVTIGSGSTLAGTGIINGGVTLLSGATLAPGIAGTNSGVGTLTINGGLTIQSGGILSVDLASSSSYDQVAVTGTVDVSSATLSVAGAYVPTKSAGGDSFAIVTNDGSDAVTGAFTSLASGTAITLNSGSVTISYAAGSNSNDIVLTGPVNQAPALGGTFTTAGTVDDNATATPFASVTVADADDSTGSFTVTITYTAANGTLSSAGGGLTGTAGSYTLTATTPGNLQTLLRALVFTPTANQVVPGGTVQTTFSLTAGDGTSSSSANTDTVITATSINDAPTALALSNSAVSIFEGTNGVVGTLSATDADTGQTLTYTLVAGMGATDNALFNISGTSLRANDAATLTGGQSYSVRVQVSDGTATYEQTFSISVTNDLVVDVTAIDGSAPVGSYAADKADGGGLDLQEAINLANNVSGNVTIRFAGTLGGTITLPGTLTVRSGVTLAMDSDTNNGSITITGNGFTLGNSFGVSVATGDTLTINSTLADDGTVASALTKSGAGTLVLGGTNNTATGGTGLNTVSVTAGTLRIGSDNNLGTGTVTLNGGTLNLNSLSGTVDNDLTLGASGGTVSLTNGTGATLSGTITGSGSLTKTGGPALTLSGSNSYSGGTTVSGTNGLSVTGSGNLGSGAVTLNSTLKITGANTTVTNAIAINDDAAIISNASAVTLSGVVSGSHAVEKQGGGTLTLGATNTHTGNWAISAGTLTASGGSAIGDSSSVTLSGSGAFRVSASETVGAVTGNSTSFTDVTIDTGIVLTATYGSDATMAGAIGGSGGFTKTGSGTLTLSGSNSYSGATTVGAGGLTINGSINANSAVSVGTGATLTVGAAALEIGSLAGAGTVAVASGKELTVGSSGASTEFSGSFSGAGDLIKMGSGTMTLSGTNSTNFSGTTAVREGTLSVAGDANLGSGTVTLNGGTLTVTGAGTIDNAVTLGTNDGTVDTAVAVTLSGVIGGSGNLTKTGAGTLTLSGSNSYSILTVSAGTVSIAADGNLGSGAVTLAAGSKLQVTGATTIDNAVALTGSAEVQTDAAVTISGNITGNTRTLTKSGSGTLTLSGTNNGSGSGVSGITVSAGTLAVGASTNLGQTTLTLDGGTLASTAVFSSGTGVTLGSGGGTIDVSAGSVTLSGTVSGVGGLSIASTNAGNVLGLSGTNSYTGGTTLGSGILQFGSDAAVGTGTLTVNGGKLRGSGSTARTIANNLVLGGTMTMSGSAALTFTGSVDLGGTARTVNNTITESLTLSGTVSNGSLTVANGGTGALVLGGTNSMTGITVSSGTLSIADAASLGTGTTTLSGGTLSITGATTIANAIAVSSGSTISNSAAATLSGVLSGAGALTKSGAGTLTLSGTNTHTGAVTVSTGTLAAAGGSAIGDTSAVTVAGNATLSLGSGTETIGSLAGAGNVVLSYRLTVGGDNTSTIFSGIISSTNASGLTKTGAGTLTLSGANTYTGSTTVSAGGLTLSGGSAIGDLTAVSVASDGTLTLSNDETIGSLAGAGTVALGANTLTTGVNNSSTTFSGTITGTTTGMLNLDGTGTLTLSGNNSTNFAGKMTVRDGGTLSVTGDANLGSGTVTLNGGTLTVTGAGTIDNDFDTGVNGATIDSAVAVTLSGAIGGSHGLTKSGTGTLTLSGTSTYAGSTTVSAGTLLVTGALGGTSGVSVASGATLGGTGSIFTSGSNQVTIADGATLAPGLAGTNNGIGTLTINGNLRLSGTLAAEIGGGGGVGGTDYDQVVVNGTVSLNGGPLTLSRVNGYTLTNGAAYRIIDNDGSDAIAGTSGTFGTFAEGTDMTSNGDIYTVSYVGGTGNDAVLTAVVNPTVSSVSATTADGSYKAGDTISITVTFNRAVTVTGTPTLALGTGRTATYSSGSGGTTLTFTYTVQAGDTSTDLDYASTTALVLNGGTIADSSSSLAALLTLAAPGAANSLGANKAIVIDTTAPGAPSAPDMTTGTDSGSSSTDNVTSNTTPTFTGTAEPNSTVTLYDTDGTTVLGTATTDGSGNYSVTPTTALTPGSHTLTVKARDAAGNVSSVSGALEVVIDTTTPTVTGVTSSTADGSYKAGSTISIQVNLSEAVTVTGTPTLALGLGNGRTATYSGGSGTGTLTFTYTVQAGDTSADLDYVSTTALALSGGTIADTAGHNAVLTLAAPGAATSLGANKAIVIDTTVPNEPGAPDMTAGSDTGSSNSDNVTSNTTPTFTGTAEPNSTVTLYDTNGTTVLGTGTTDGSGNYSVTVATPLAPGLHTLTVKAADAAGNVSIASSGLAVMIDTTAPNEPGAPDMTAGSDTGSSNSDNVTSNTTPTFTGIADSNSTVTLYDTDGTTVLGTATADGAGNYSITPAAPLAPGSHTLSVKATDAAGNVSTTSGRLAIVIDTTAPNEPSAPDMTAGSDTGSSNSDNVTSNTTPTFTGTAEPNSTVTLYDTNGTTVLGTATADGAGNYSITPAAPLAPGLHTLTVKATDAAGNASTVSGRLAVMIDTTAPDAPSAPDMTAGSDTGSSNSDNVTSNTTPTFTGTAEPNSIVTLYDTNGTTVLGTATADGAGNYSITPAAPLAPGSHTLTVKATDPAGNVSTSSGGLTVVVDTAAPTTPDAPTLSGASDTGSSSSDAITSNTTPTFTGTAEPNSTVTIILDGVAAGTTTADTDGRWSFTVTTPLADGTHGVRAMVTDTAGNAAQSGILTWTVDTRSPTVLASSGATLSAGGTVSVGAAVSLSDASALDRVTISLTDARSGDELVIGALPTGITATRTGNSIVLSGSASAADYQAAIRAISLRSSASDPSFDGTATSRSITVEARDAAGNAPAAATVTVTVARATTSPINTTNTPAITTPVTGSGNGPSLSGGSASGSSSNGPSSSGSSAPSLPSNGLPGGLGIGGFGPSLPGSGGSGSNGLTGSASSTDAGRSVTLGSVGGSSSSTDAGRSVTLGSVGGNSSSTDAGRSVTLNSVGGGSSSSFGSSGSGLGGNGLGGGLGAALGGSLGGGLGGNGLGGLGSGPGAGLGTGGTPGATNAGIGTGANTGTGTPGQTGTQGNGPNNGPNNGQGRGQGAGQEQGNAPGTVPGRGPATGQPGTQGQGQQDQGEQGQGEQQGQPPQNQDAPQDGGGIPAGGAGQPAERGADTRAEIMPASPGFARQVARAHGGPADAAGLLAALASHVLPDSRAA
ncbi:DUF4347 domain-containing protein [Azospirillum sp. YIM B02556]|uniref:DUF4347 domain-containing protein n=1 Tax=Azospirillum endophyticum TaxID=2800326 RepID=A0ABS1FBF8_9PROT|nr:Ig-like domain-containing protein [Azospirillum endophyticum]MBK1840759.1 DUF4347 domain-containing protein [Azospirillum endophyticum]